MECLGYFCFSCRAKKHFLALYRKAASPRQSHCAWGQGKLSWCGGTGTLTGTECTLIKDVAIDSTAKFALTEMKDAPWLTELWGSLLQACPARIPALLWVKKSSFCTQKCATLWWALTFLGLSAGFLSSSFLQSSPDPVMMWRLSSALALTTCAWRLGEAWAFSSCVRLCVANPESFCMFICVPVAILNEMCTCPPKPAFGCSFLQVSSEFLLNIFCEFTCCFLLGWDKLTVYLLTEGSTPVCPDTDSSKSCFSFTTCHEVTTGRILLISERNISLPLPAFPLTPGSNIISCN